jgi:outer membrane protein
MRRDQRQRRAGARERLRLGLVRVLSRTTLAWLVPAYVGCVLAQNAPVSADHPWHAVEEQAIEADARNNSLDTTFHLDPAKTYSLSELVDLAEAHNPETRFAWERARAQAAALGIAQSELYPTLAAAALSETGRDQAFFGNRFYSQSTGDLQVALDLSYDVFDFGARSGRISAARAEVLVANFAFNDAHRNVIFQVEQAYYRRLNALGEEDAARASLANAQAVEQAADERLANGLATLPDVLEARSARAQAEYDLATVIGAEEIARGDLATAVGTSATMPIHTQPLELLPTPESIGDTVEQAIARALDKRPDLLQQVAEIRSADARVKEARAAYYPQLNLDVNPAAQSLYGIQSPYPWANTATWAGSVRLGLQWTVFDGGARRNQLAQARANVNASEAQANVVRNQIVDEVWTAYSNLHTAFRQRQAALALLEAASQSYNAALESYNYGVRSLLDVTAAQRALAQARSADVLARTQVLTSLADLAFRTADSIQANRGKP